MNGSFGKSRRVSRFSPSAWICSISGRFGRRILLLTTAAGLAASLSLAPSPAAAEGEFKAEFARLVAEPSQDGDSVLEILTDPVSLSLTLRPEVSRALSQKLLEAFEARTSVSGEQLRLIRGLLGENGLHKLFRQVMDGYGLSERNFADVLTGCLVMLWQISNDVEELKEDEVVSRAISADLRRILADSETLRGLDQLERQFYAESLIVSVMLVTVLYGMAKNKGDRAAAAEAARRARDLALAETGLDLPFYRVSAAGLTPR